jgi:histidinol phosphatase-like enzyme
MVKQLVIPKLSRKNRGTCSKKRRMRNIEFKFRKMNRCVFLDRDGVINKDNPNYSYRVDEFHILPGVIEAIALLKDAGFLLVVVTNQSGIAQKIYTEAQMKECHDYLQ